MPTNDKRRESVRLAKRGVKGRIGRDPLDEEIRRLEEAQ
jgi:hypothetical protein